MTTNADKLVALVTELCDNVRDGLLSSSTAADAIASAGSTYVPDPPREPTEQESLTVRRATINRAIDFIENYGSGATHVLRQTSIHPHLQDDPTELVARLREALKDDASTGHRFGAWKASQRICKAAGLEY